MATAEQIKTLIKAYFENNNERFVVTALQVAANEAKLGHTTFANEIRKIVDNSKKNNSKIIKFTPDLSDLILSSKNNNILGDLVSSDEIKNKIKRILKEYYQKDKLLKHGLSNRRKILLSGAPGTGKTMTASIIANELKLPFYEIQMDKIVNKYMGETSAKLRQIFDNIQERKGVFLFDEFDAIGAERGSDNEVGEMRRVLNSFLQFLEQDDSESIIIAATNNIKLLDNALFRRFNDIFIYENPIPTERKQLFRKYLALYPNTDKWIDICVKESDGLSHSEITQACIDAIKETILSDKNYINKKTLLKSIKDRKTFIAEIK